MGGGVVGWSGEYRYEATSVEASDRHLDLAVIRIDAKGLTPLALGVFMFSWMVALPAFRTALRDLCG